MNIIAIPDQSRLDDLLLDLHQQGMTDQDISLIRRQYQPPTTAVVERVDGPLEGGIPEHSLVEAMKDSAERTMPGGAAIGTVGGAVLATTLAMAGPIGWVALLGIPLVGGAIGALTGVGVGAIGGALEKAGEETHHTEIIHQEAATVGQPIVEGNLNAPALTPEQQAQGREIVENGGVLIHIDEARFPNINPQNLAMTYGGHLL